MNRILLVSLVVIGCLVGVGMADTRCDGSGIVVVAHRGCAPGYPENTLPAFAHALELGVDVIEADLQMTKDGVVVILHEDTVDYTTDGTGFVSDYTFAELRQLDAGSHAGAEFAGEPIPSLDEALGLVIPLGGKLLLDIKESNDLDCEGIVQLIEQHDAVLDVIVGVRSLDDARLFTSLNPNIRLLGFVPGIKDIEAFVEAGVDIVRLWSRWVRIYPPCVGKVHELGRAAWVTSGYASRDELSELIGAGADGFITDLPDVLIALLNERSGD